MAQGFLAVCDIGFASSLAAVLWDSLSLNHIQPSFLTGFKLSHLFLRPSLVGHLELPAHLFV